MFNVLGLVLRIAHLTITAAVGINIIISMFCAGKRRHREVK